MQSAPVIGIDVPGSFAWGVFHERHPKLIQQVLDALPYGPAQRTAISHLLTESTAGVLEPLSPDAWDYAQWHDWGGPLWGKPWSEAPFLWAESYFYRRLLEATGYFRPGAWQGIDPFAPFKSAELASSLVDNELAALSRLDELPESRRAEALLLSALWGNRADLGFQIIAGTGGPTAPSLIADDSALLWAELERSRGGRVCVVADNAGSELLPDLVLIDHLLTTGLASEAVLYVKPQPYYVSDATMTDTIAAVSRLRTASMGGAADTGTRLWRAMNDGTFVVRTHPFYCAPLPYHSLPADLRTEFAGAAMTILKGDLNYRRLVGDQLWPPTTPFTETAGYFPSAVSTLRTLKSDVIVGLDASTVAQLDATGTAWRTDGRHAVIQVSLLP